MDGWIKDKGSRWIKEKGNGWIRDKEIDGWIREVDG